MGTEGERALLDELERVTNLRVVQPQMVSGRVQGAFLRLVVQILRPNRVLEIGTFTGYSALSMAAGLGDSCGGVGNRCCVGAVVGIVLWLVFLIVLWLVLGIALALWPPGAGAGSRSCTPSRWTTNWRI